MRWGHRDGSRGIAAALKAGPTEILKFVNFTGDGQSATLVSSLAADTACVLIKNIARKTERVLAANYAAASK